jgi:hypothetical protein
VEDVELDGEGVGVSEGAAVGVDEGVDAAGVGLELLESVCGEEGGGAIGGGAELEDALLAVVLDERWAEDLGELTGAVAAKGVHLEEAVLRGDEALGEEQVVEVGGVDGGNSLGVAGDGDGSGEAGDGDVAVELWESRAHRVAESDAGGDDGDDEEQHEDLGGDEDALDPDAARRRKMVGILRRAPVAEVAVETSLGVVFAECVFGACVFGACGCGEAHKLEQF